METGVAVSTEGPSKPRIIRWIVVGLLVALLIATGIAAAVVARYNPVAHGSSGGTPRLSLPHHDVDDPEGGHRRVVTYVQGGTLDVALSVRNRGPWGVTILGVSNLNFGLFHVTEVRRGVLNRCCIKDEPFAPFALHPGEDRMIILHGVLAGCRNVARGGGVSWSDYEIRYRMMGISRSTTIEAFSGIEIHIPEGYKCTEQPAEFVPSPRPSPQPTA